MYRKAAIHHSVFGGILGKTFIPSFGTSTSHEYTLQSYEIVYLSAMKKKHLVIAVTNNLLYDQRVQRISSALSEEYKVTLVGRSKSGNRGLEAGNIGVDCVWLPCIFSSGKLFYFEYQIRLFFFLLFLEFDVIYAVDHDTLWGGFGLGWLRRKARIYDAHEYFEEVPELAGRSFSKKLWSLTGKIWVPTAHLCITVNDALADILSQRYKMDFIAICNMPVRRERSTHSVSPPSSPIVLYQGVLNVGRGLPEMIKALEYLPDTILWLAGEGDLSEELRQQAKASPVADRIVFHGFVLPDQLHHLTVKASVGINLLEGDSLNYVYSLANKFFDYVHAGIPQISMNYPVYQSFVDKFNVGILIDNIEPENIANAISHILHPDQYKCYVDACQKASEIWHWESQVPILLDAVGLAIENRNH